MAKIQQKRFLKASALRLKIESIKSSNRDDNNNNANNDLIGTLYNILNDDIRNDEISIGRSRRSNDIVIKDLSISTNHAKIMFNKGRFYLIDCNSKHGTYLNGKKLLIEQHIIDIGTEIRFGRIICKIIEMDDTNTTTNFIADEHVSIKSMNYYENLLKEEHLYNQYNVKRKRYISEVEIEDKMTMIIMNQIDNDNNQNENNNDENDDMTYNSKANTGNSYNNTTSLTSKRVQQFVASTRISESVIKAPSPAPSQLSMLDSIYSVGAAIFKNVYGGDPSKKLGKNVNDEVANELLQLHRRAKNLGLGSIAPETTHYKRVKKRKY